jgi:hypothetical protein
VARLSLGGRRRWVDVAGADGLSLVVHAAEIDRRTLASYIARQIPGRNSGEIQGSLLCFASSGWRMGGRSIGKRTQGVYVLLLALYVIRGVGLLAHACMVPAAAVHVLQRHVKTRRVRVG